MLALKSVTFLQNIIRTYGIAPSFNIKRKFLYLLFIFIFIQKDSQYRSNHFKRFPPQLFRYFVPKNWVQPIKLKMMKKRNLLMFPFSCTFCRNADKSRNRKTQIAVIA